jgi:organic hydroperoxide reductase OsmC/OhrA
MGEVMSHEYAIVITGGPAVPVRASAAPRPDLEIGPPPEFGGSDVWWSPEQLLLAALASCFDVTFRALAGRAGVPIVDLHSRARGTVGKTQNGLAFTRLHLAVEVTVRPADADQARELLVDAERKCIVRNSLRVPIAIESIVELSPGQPS